MKALLKTICEDAFHNKENGNLNIFGIFEQINVPKFPAVKPMMTFLFILEGEAGKQYSYSFDIADSAGKKIYDSSTLPPDKKLGGALGINGRAHLRVNIRMLSFPRAGVYSANFHFNDDTEESIEFSVMSVEK